jgi:DNA-directed RNA polymerase subunit RPC12/RpoP
MTTDDTIVKCGKCKAVLQERSDIKPAQRTPCPECGSTSRAFEVTMHANISIHTKMGMKAKRSGEKKPFIVEVSGSDLYRKINKWMKLSRVIDKENDYYCEVITDPVTGQIVHECIEPLSKHIGHGNAKRKKSSPRRSST